MLCQQLYQHNSIHQVFAPSLGVDETLAIARFDSFSFQGCCVQIEMQVTEFNSVLSAAHSSRTGTVQPVLHTAHSKSNDGLAIIAEASHDRQQP